MILTRRALLIGGASCAIAAPARAADWLPLATTSYFAQASTIFAAFTTPPVSARQALINSLVGSLLSAGIWASLDCLYLLAAADSQAALINWKNPGTFNATLVNAPSFVADLGYTGNGSTSYVETGYNISSGGGTFAQNNAHMGLFVLTNSAQTAANMGVGVSNYSHISSRNTSDQISVRINSNVGGVAIASITNSIGLTAWSRTGAATSTVYKNGVNVGTSVTASSALVNETIRICSAVGQFSTKQMSMASFGGSLTDSQMTTLYNAVLAYMQGVGAA